MERLSEKYKYTPRFDGGLIVIVARCVGDRIVVGGIGIRLVLHMSGA